MVRLGWKRFFRLTTLIRSSLPKVLSKCLYFCIFTLANSNITDMTEEDAADLQFPKDCSLIVSPRDKFEHDVEFKMSVKDEILTSDSRCHVCRSILVEPYIRCAMCNNVEICCLCFAEGCEINEHKNYHDYVIINNEFPLIDGSGWTAKQELELLDVVQQCGFGNWIDVEGTIKGKSAEECKMHYLQHYIDNQTLPGLPKIRNTRASLFACEQIPYLFKLQDIEEPPRFAPDTLSAMLLAGYNAARSDFEVNFDNHAESVVANLEYDEFQPDDDAYALGQALQTAIVQAYNNRLKERARRRRIVRDHGLIIFRKSISWTQRYENTVTRSMLERLLLFVQLVDGMEFDFLMEGLHRAGELKNRINRLLEYRHNGLTHFHSVSMFQKLSKMRQDYERERKQYMSNPEYSWRSLLPDGFIVPIPGHTPRRAAPPLMIKGLPGYQKLNAVERDLCSVARIVPESYLDFKQLLITENKKSGSLKLAQARILLKIDVNKTRKIYDFLVENGYINKPVQ